MLHSKGQKKKKRSLPKKKKCYTSKLFFVWRNEFIYFPKYKLKGLVRSFIWDINYKILDT